MPDLKITKIFLQIPKKRAARIIIILSSLALLYHALILTDVIPYKYVWGGKIETLEQLWLLESISIVLNFAIIYLAASSAKLLKSLLPMHLCIILSWFFAGLLFFNTIGNLAAEEPLETLVFTPMTAVMSILFIRIALKETDELASTIK